MDPRAFAHRWQQAVALFEGGRYAESLSIVRELAKAEPRQPDVLHLAALAAMRTGDGDAAVRFQRKAVKLRPDDVGLAVNLAAMHAERRQWAEALEAFRAADAIRPDMPAVLKGMIRCLLAIDRPRGPARHHSPELEEAADLSRRLLALTPDDTETALRLARSLFALERFGEAKDILVPLADAHAPPGPAHHLLTAILIQEGDTAGAERLCRAVLAADPTDPSACLHLTDIDATAFSPAPSSPPASA